MIRRIGIYRSLARTIDENLALEEYLMTQVKESSGILFLWSNEPTVVIGRNQNPWRECNLALMEKEGVTLARRKSGGGAVYQDTGNLNISFLCREEDYDVPGQNRIWLDTLADLGITAHVDGRNDILLENGKKCSGMAYHQSGSLCLQHGTLLVNTDLERLETCLMVSSDKLVSKGIASVRSRVGDLTEYDPDLSVEAVADRILQILPQIYPQAEVHVSKDPETEETFRTLWEKYASWEWKYGRKMQFTWKREARFSWGELQVFLQIRDGRILDVQMYSDCLYPDDIQKAAEALRGCGFDAESLKQRLSACGRDILEPKMTEDLLIFFSG